MTVIIISLLLSGFFSGMEIAFVAANKLRVEVEKQKGGFSARLLSPFVRSEASFISTMLVGNNIALVVYGISFAALLQPVLQASLPSPLNTAFVVFLFQTIISSFIILIVAEFLPKTLFRIQPNRMLELFALPAVLIYYILYPVIAFTMMVSDLIMRRVAGDSVTADKKVFDAIDMDNFLQEFGQADNDEGQQQVEIQMFRNAIEFPEVKLRECLLPRTEIVAVPQSADIVSIRRLFSETGLSKILVYGDSVDDMIGYVHVFDLFSQPASVHAITRPVLLVPESMHANKLLKNLIQQRKSIAVVVDEFGGTAGIITIEDIMEEIFGEIDDEHDVEDLVEKKTGENEYLFSARLEIDYLNDKYQMNIPESDEYETLGGLVINCLERIPVKGEEVQIGQLHMKILQVSQKRVELLKVET